ncbi:GOLPH3/VPS74 family protein [Granulicoccus sp. GXG6511]|uniref:GOLPH3/VPS74 family protein n=1 Tax=Granulicoccus sp. GXG6511 TaxID=3381351 RepID=UPI003D7E2D11
MSEFLLAEDLALLLLHDETGWLRGQHADIALAGAVLTELAIRGRIRLTEKGERDVRPNRVTVVDDSATDDPLLDEALARLAARRARFQQTSVQLLRGRAKPAILDRLVDRGVLERREVKLLGLIPLKTYPMRDHTYEDGLRRRLFTVLVRDEEPTVRDACLIALLSAMGLAAKTIAEDVSTVDKRAIRRRANAMRRQHWAAEAAYRLIQAQEGAAAG